MIPLDVDDVGADFYAGNCHKWLLAPIGTGFLVVGPGNEDRLEPLHVSWGYKPDQYPIGEDSTTKRRPGRPGRLRLDAAGAVPGVRGDARRLPVAGDAGRDRLPGRARLGATPQSHGRTGGVHPRPHPAAAGHPGRPPAVRGDDGVPAAGWAECVATAEGTVGRTGSKCPVIERPDRLLLRVSHHFYTTEAEIDHLAEVLPTLLGERPA